MRINVFKSGGNSAEGGFVSNGLTLQGPLILSGPHTDHLHAVPKQYVDNVIYNLDATNITSGVLAAGRLPSFTGDATTILGTSNIILSNTGVTPGSIVKPTVDAKGRVISGGSIVASDISAISFDKITAGRPTTLNGYGITDGIPLSSNITITGNFIQPGDPITGQQVATKHYVDASAGLAGGIAVGDILRKPYTTTPTGFLKCNGAEVDKTTYANLYSVIGDTFKLNTTVGAGKPWQQQYEINTTQNTDLIGWSTVTALPGTLVFAQAVVTKNRVHLICGYNGTSAYVTTVYTAPINADGTLGTWTTGGVLPSILSESQAIVTKNRVYMIGGWNGTATVTTVYTAPINADGTLGTWTTGTALPSAIYGTSIVVIGTKVYLVGGNNGSTSISTIYSTDINADGTIGSWSVYASLPASISHAQAAVIRNKLYIFGGWTGSVSKSQVYYCDINSDNSLGAWNSGISLPTTLLASSIYVTKTKVYLIGGMITTATPTSNICSANINSDGSLGTWSINSSLPGVYANTPIVATKDHLFAIGGRTASNSYSSTVYSLPINGGVNDYSSYYSDDPNNYLMPGSGRPWVEQYQINTTQSTNITGWTNGNLPFNIGMAATVVTKNRVYLLGGWSSGINSASSTVRHAIINSDGTLGTWETGTALPGPTSQCDAIVTKNRVYVIGGSNSVTGLSTTYTAAINADGTLGTWTTGTSLPGGLFMYSICVTRNRVYLMSGHNGTSYVSVVYTAPINSDGTLGTWTTSASLPGILSSSQAIITKNRVYLISGFNGSGYVSTIYTASINTDGSLGTWTTAGAFPNTPHSHRSFVTKNRVYIFGGFNGASILSNVYSAPINSDGTLGTWVTDTSLPSYTNCSSVFVTKNNIYILGNWSGASTVLNTIYTAPISSDTNDYSPYYDGTIEPVSTISTTFKLPDYTTLDKEFGEYVTSYIKF